MSLELRARLPVLRARPVSCLLARALVVALTRILGAMDFLDSDAGSSPPASDEANGVEAGNESGDRDLTRESVDVGERINLRDFTGRCVGDNVSWKGSAALRVALQSARSAGDRCES